ncbi:hypothetical protein A2533_04025 [Candidatus Falkowbacteria bacterium RIFOXYD2_FULL_35_9]|uniref:Uncharacterized protein n=1 Tax=Candidatus Falkowbacteria bacterium RIFOXYC2_FULL_36_12 TaxID=1798002 RepID=A0A1F5SYR2_9BACT|nr:MAG: hypothetical protein A2300_00360 [Candidatus Falkowbacteria bacterium RIFOXYB2_FULL_35_7]OGF31626.1 MAG: hypothetical protein A2478_04020 [Candidatus Falkowbacteria bacterium RIFOXYC2_FULL_36_12]OGF34172.1 MAG: hypothetical protein A2223_01950 [Candidatus Falkowbacteria bacterium RIFOXYA2_FULL_35_8]OGF46694.1 MAG: hypothetical protein A2533_04025 [Candidatus Falkowbacteria bacterium RIFOXYD2_FULL_35_9]
MSLKNYLILIAICAGISWVAWFLVLFSVEADQSGFLGFVFFYTSLFFALLGTFSILGYYIRSIWRKTDLWYKQLNVSSRQALILSLLVVSALILQSQRYLQFWNLLILITLAVFFEALFLSYRHGTR